jgi:hypothetical protein
MKLPYNTKLPKVRGVVFKNTHSTKVVKIEKIFIGSKSGKNLTIGLWVINDTREAIIIPDEYPFPIKGLYELEGPVYLNPGDTIEGLCAATDTDITISIQGINDAE